MLRLRFRRRKPEQSVMSSGGMASIKDEEILRVVRDIRRRHDLPDLVTKSSRRSRSTTAPSSKSSKEKTQLREGGQLPEQTEQTEQPEHTQPPDEHAQLPAVQIFDPVVHPTLTQSETKPAVQIFKPVVVHPTVTQSETKNVSLSIPYGRKSSKCPNRDEKRTPNATVHRSVSSPLLQLKKNRKAPPAVNTSLDCSTSGYDFQTRCISSNDTSARSSAFSPRTPKSIQRFSFLCSEAFPCNHTKEEDVTIDNTSSSDSGTDDDRSWKSNSKKRQALAKRPPSFFREVYDQVIEDLGGGIEEVDTILAASPRKCEEASYSESCDSPDNESFLCSEVSPCNHTQEQEEDATIDNTSSSDLGTDDDRSWKSNSMKRQVLAKHPPSFFREVYDQVIGELGGGIEEVDTILAASPRKCEEASYSESCDSPDNESSPMSAAPGKSRTRHARTIHSIMKVLDNSTDLSSESTNDKNETDEDDDTTSLSQALSDGLLSVPSRVYAYRQTLSSTSNL